MQEDRSALGRALNALRRPAEGVCVRCGTAFTSKFTSAKRPRRYCSASCRQMDYFERKREAKRHTPTPPAAPGEPDG